MDELAGLIRVRRLTESGEAKALRAAAGVSLAEIAEPVGVTPPTIWRWENHGRVPRGDAALRYLDVLEQLAKATRGRRGAA